MIVQLDPPLWLQTPKGEGLAHFLEAQSLEQSLYWIVFQEDGQIWRWENERVRAVKNITLGRNDPEKPKANPS